MGKADNIKRAKKIKEAKRNREKEELISAGLGPASIAIKKRAEKNRVEILLNQSNIKYSELLKLFVHPIVQEENDIEILKTKYIFGVYAWNAALLKEKSEKAYLQAKKDIISIMPNSSEFELLFDEMVKRKQEEFAEYKNLIIDFEIKKIHELDYNLCVATTPLND